MSNSPIDKALGALRTALNQTLTQREADLARSITNAAATVEQRKALAVTLNLTERLFEIYEEIRFYPSWAVNCPEELCSAVADVNAPQDHRDELAVAFTLNGTRYSFLYAGHWTTFPDGDSSYYADLSLTDSSGKALYTLWLERGEFRTRFIDIKAFVPGPWIADFLELSERIAILKRERALRAQEKQLKEQIERFGLDQKGDEITRLTTQFGVQVESSTEESAFMRRVGRWLAGLIRRRQKP
ncbi:MAG: hypothetical protein ACRERE_43250 [Candidatus Entotheonellia bacterium]